MEKKLLSMFAYQRFASNPRLDKLISDTESRCGKALEDDALWMVNAAGNQENCFPELRTQKRGDMTNGTEK